MMCNTGCGLNKTHTSGFHGNYKSNSSLFSSQLPTTNTYYQIIKCRSPDMQTLTEDQMVINSSKWKSVLEYHERTSKILIFLLFAVF